MKYFCQNDSMGSETAYGYNLMFICYMLNRKMINDSHVWSFLKNLCENISKVGTQ